MKLGRIVWGALGAVVVALVVFMSALLAHALITPQEQVGISSEDAEDGGTTPEAEVATTPNDEEIDWEHADYTPIAQLTTAEVVENVSWGEVTVAETFAMPARRDLSQMINLQAVVDRWARDYRGSYRSVSVEIYDMDYNTVVASYNATAAMSPRSLYKLFYTYDTYARIDAGKDDANQLFLGNLTLGQCLDLMIRESNNPCAEAMLASDERSASAMAMAKRLGLTGTRSDGLVTTAHDISLMLQQYYRHPDWTENSWRIFRDSALYQAWLYRKGLPSGFETAVVYNKTGYGPDVYNDAALVEFSSPSGTWRYVMAVMTLYPSSYTILTELGSRLEYAILYGD